MCRNCIAGVAHFCWSGNGTRRQNADPRLGEARPRGNSRHVFCVAKWASFRDGQFEERPAWEPFFDPGCREMDAISRQVAGLHHRNRCGRKSSRRLRSSPTRRRKANAGHTRVLCLMCLFATIEISIWRELQTERDRSAAVLELSRAHVCFAGRIRKTEMKGPQGLG